MPDEQQKPLFSIVTASYNYENYIKETIESVLSQTFSNWEMIIIDDGSSDNSVDVIKSYCAKDNRIKLVCHPDNKNRGLIETVKLGVEKANANWIVFLESDDTITNNYLEKKLEIIKERPEVKFIFNNVNLFGNNERIKQLEPYFTITKPILKNNPYPDSLFKYFKKVNMVPTFSVVALKKELLDKIDYKCPIKTNIDYYLWIQIAKKTNIYYLDEKLTNWRVHDSYITHYKKSNYETAYFDFKKNLMFLTPAQKPLIPFLYMCFLFTVIRKSLIKLHIKGRGVCIFGRWYHF